MLAITFPRPIYNPRVPKALMAIDIDRFLLAWCNVAREHKFADIVWEIEAYYRDHRPKTKRIPHVEVANILAAHLAKKTETGTTLSESLAENLLGVLRGAVGYGYIQCADSEFAKALPHFAPAADAARATAMILKDVEYVMRLFIFK